MLDALGPQGHFLGGTQYDSAWVARRLNELSANSGGLPIDITEFDLNIENDTFQRQKYQEVLGAMFAHPNVRGVMMWGYYEGGTWLGSSHAVREDGSERPAMQWLRSYFEDEPRSADRLEAEQWDAMLGMYYTEDSTGVQASPTTLITGLGGDSTFIRFKRINTDGSDAIVLRYAATEEGHQVGLVLNSAHH